MAYSPDSGSATPGLAGRIREKILGEGPLSFPHFMAAALYDPQEGYYARPAGQVGRGGDFFTSVSAGPLFGRLLAECVLEWYYEAVMPPRWRLIEVGANDGSLASDLHAALRGMDVELGGMEHVVIEPLPQLATALREKCGDFLGVVDSAEVLADDPLPSFVLGNEVLDALPFHLIESDGRAWQELGVTLEGGTFAWTGIGPVAPELVKGIPVFPAGYRTEVRGNFRDFLAPLVAAMDGGRMLWIDYGFPRDDYYHESRTTGTLRTFSRHRAAEDPLQSPGEIDITAHVDFTAVEEAVRGLGGKVLLFERQGRFLTNYARPWLRSMEGRTDAEAMKAVRAFQTLTHPGQLGASFHMMMAEWAG
jgi:SAM-dependent MidA family methyltransferase